MPVSLDGATYRRMLEAAAVALEQDKASIDALNVFPVPDGDTGTNMSLTLSSALREMAKSDAGGVGELAKAVALGSLMGARGNSGVILSQLFRGFSREAEGRPALTPAEFARGLQGAVDTAYKAVMKPVEGTILTVARLSARAALQAGRQGAELVQVLETAYHEACRALERTPEMLPVLKEAGVVDAGGQGLVAIFRGYLQAAQGLAPAAGAVAAVPERRAEFAITDTTGDLTFIYDTEVLLRGSALPLDELREELGALGDSLLVVGDEQTAKVHIHTNSPGMVLERCLARGSLLEIEIKNMQEQYETIRREREARGDLEPEFFTPPQRPKRELTVVAVAVGEGLCEIIRSLGAEVVVNGGQTMNPSTEEIVRALESVDASHIIVLPNNSNIVLTARQAAELSGLPAHIVPTRTVPQGVAALLAMSPAADLQTNLERMHRAVESTTSGEITFAVRQTRYKDMDIRPGDVIGLLDEEIMAVGSHWRDVLLDLLARTVNSEHQVLTLYYGQDIAEDEAEAVRESLVATYPDLEVEIYDGGQPLYYVLFSLE